MKGIRAVCEHCGRKTRWYTEADMLDLHDDPTKPVRLHIWEAPRGWSVAPYPPGFEHSDGTHGDKWTCADCSKRRDFPIPSLHIECTEIRDDQHTKIPAHRLQPGAGAVPTPEEKNMNSMTRPARHDESAHAGAGKDANVRHRVCACGAAYCARPVGAEPNIGPGECIPCSYLAGHGRCDDCDQLLPTHEAPVPFRITFSTEREIELWQSLTPAERELAKHETEVYIEGWLAGRRRAKATAE